MGLKRVRPIFLMGLGVALLALPVVGAPPPKTEVCTFTGDIVGGGDPTDGAPVEIGVSVSAWELLVPGTDQKSTLWLAQGLLNDAEGLEYLPEGAYHGQARVLKKDGRFDFDFGDETCISPTYGDAPPFWSDGDGLCPYRLIILDGIYDRTTDSVFWEAGSRVQLDDYTAGPPYVAAAWSSDTYLFSAEFGTAGEEPPPEPEPESEKTKDACSDEVDNDGDGAVDCDDPDCGKWRWCR
jgi:hypothetical protein